jgi:hypothetical protein
MRSLIINNKDRIIFIGRIYNIVRMIFVNDIVKIFVIFDHIINRLQDFNTFNYITIYYIINQIILSIVFIVSLLFIIHKICLFALII